MIIIILLILFRTLTTINTYTPPSEMNPNCQCSASNLDDINLVYNSKIADIDTQLNMNVKSWDNLKIFCKKWKGWEEFKLPSISSGKIMNTVYFKHCGLSNEISLNDVAKKLGVEETSTLIFESFKNLETTLEREHFKGFSNVTKLVLSYNGLTNISKDLFVDFPKLEWLDLSQNNLVLPDDIFDKTPNLKGIELIGNEIKTISQRLFRNLKNLEVLNLMGNNLVELEAGIFDELVSLKNFNLARNSLLQTPASIFYELKKLERVDISFNNFVYISPNLFAYNKELRYLYLHDNKPDIITLPISFLSSLEKLEEVVLKNNGFKHLPESLFWGSSSLKYINLNDNYFLSLPRDIFSGLQNVEELSLKNNKIIILPLKIFADLEKLKKLDLSMNRMIFIERFLFKSLKSLTELNIERNRLRYIEYRALFPMTNLRIAKFSHNKLKMNTTSRKWSPFYNNRLLEEVHLSNNSIQSFFSDWSLSKSNLKLLNLSHNNIHTLPTNDFLFPSNNITIDLRYNHLRAISIKEIEEVAIYQSDDRDVYMLIEHNPLSCDCHLYDILRYRENRMPVSVYNYIKIKMNNSTCYQADGNVGPKLEYLDSRTYKCIDINLFRTGRNCHHNCTCYIKPEDNTRILDCSYKKMSEFRIDKSRLRLVKGYPLILNLTGNLLTEMPSIESLKSINLIGLLLSDNHISKVTVDKILPDLLILELHNNNITTIDVGVLDYLNSISLNELTLSGNPIKCDCTTINLIQFLQSKRFLYIDLENFQCIRMDLSMCEEKNE